MPENPEARYLPPQCERLSLRDVDDLVALASTGRPNALDTLSSVAYDDSLSVSERADIIGSAWAAHMASDFQALDRRLVRERHQNLFRSTVCFLAKLGLAIGPSMGFAPMIKPIEE